jgi:type II secretory pathway component PulJ
MRFKPTSTTSPRGAKNTSRGAFTLVEVLAALLFMAIVIPAAMQGIRVASMAGEVSQRKTAAARIAEKVLNEAIVNGQMRGASTTGTAREGMQQFQWEMRSESWTQSADMKLITVKVTYPVQGRNYQVGLSTLVNANTL